MADWGWQLRNEYGICSSLRKDIELPDLKDFLKDILGKCDICFRAGFCTLTECQIQKSNELRLITHIVETSEFIGKIDNETGKGYIVNDDETNHSLHDMIKHNLRHRIDDSIKSEDAHIVAMEVGDIIHSAISPDNNNQLNEKKIMLDNFKLNANVVSEYIDKAVDALKTVLEDVGKMKDYKTVSPVENKKKNDKSNKKLNMKMQQIIGNVEQTIKKNLAVISKTGGQIKKRMKNVDNIKQKALSKHHNEIPEKKKKHFDQLNYEKEILGDFLNGLGQIFNHITEKKQTVKGFKYRLN